MGSRTGLIIGAGVVALILLAGVALWVLWPSSPFDGLNLGTATSGSPAIATTPSATTTQAATTSCKYWPATDQRPARDVGMPGDPDRTPAGGTVRVTLTTDHGDIPLTLDRSKAPCAVQSTLFLAGQKYFDATTCHRLTTAPDFQVLQCGDPTGTGAGGPGYLFDDELPRGLKAGGSGAVIYPKGTVAMANAGPNTNGGQFFLVYGDTTLTPNYSVLGTYTDPGQATLDKIAAAGIVPRPGEEQLAGDGVPKTPVTVRQAAIEPA